ncbi:Programmed_cell death protein-like protein [Hexamita inflata]|uniref:Programmed cell death protein-like protein n=1 Tax=Hexamita inflata TaxID=28002 RepID=A0AA86UQ58_9EUKA|nr:Programmed cell death protein-like protein [Hexamita inflata]
MFPQFPTSCPTGYYPPQNQIPGCHQNPNLQICPQNPDIQNQIPGCPLDPTMQICPQNPNYIENMTFQQQLMFQQMDKDFSGTIEVNELVIAYQQMGVSESVARILLRAVTDKPHIDHDTFPAFDNMIQMLHRAFMQFGQPVINVQNIEQALVQCQLQVQTALVHQLIKKYSHDSGADFGQFLGIASYLLLCKKLFMKFNNQGRVTLDFQGISNLGIWFV